MIGFVIDASVWGPDERDVKVLLSLDGDDDELVDVRSPDSPNLIINVSLDELWEAVWSLRSQRNGRLAQEAQEAQEVRPA